MYHFRNAGLALPMAAAAALAAPAILRRAKTRDGMMTYDARTVDSTGAFLIGELERLDQNLHDPLVAVTWSRDIDLREDVTMADEVSSFTNSSFASSGTLSAGGKAWISKDANSITGIALDIAKTTSPLTLWGMELKWTIPELESAMKLGRPVDQQKYTAMQLKHQMDIDEQVYIGDTDLGQYGLLNSTRVTNSTNVVAGASTHTDWARKTHDEILADVNELLTSVYLSSGAALVPTHLRLPPIQFSQLVSRKVSDAGNMSILEYLRINSLCNAANGRPLDIQPIKWLTGRGVSGADRMIAYSKDKERVRFPMVPLARTPLEYRSLFQITTYYGRLGAVEFVYPETIGYRDGI